jgi:hypothetical protein
MEYIYIATSSLNLNNILSTESISPEVFYNKKKFGFKRFEKVEPNPLSNILIGYNKAPKFQIIESDRDDYPMIIKINSELIKENVKNEEKDGIKIYQIDTTIYLHPQKVEFLFLNEKERKIALIKVEPSIESKLLPVYKKKIKFLKENDKGCFDWEKSFISKLPDLQNKKVEKQLDLDSKTNKLKGFYYSYILGIILSSSIKERTLTESINYVLNKEEFISITKKELTRIDNDIIEKLEKINTEITNDISKLKQKETKKTDPKILIEKLNFNSNKITQLDDDLLNDKEADTFRNIINELLEEQINNTQTFKEEKINLALKMGNILKESTQNWEKSKKRDYLNSLIDNIEKYQAFELKSHDSILLQSIALFILKGEDPEKLIESLKENQLSDYRIALGLWGCIFGFSTLPKTLTNILFEEKNIENYKLLYNDIQSKLHDYTGSKEEIEFESESVNSQKILVEKEKKGIRAEGTKTISFTENLKKDKAINPKTNKKRGNTHKITEVDKNLNQGTEKDSYKEKFNKQNILGFGKHSKLTYEEVLEKDPGYYDWMISDEFGRPVEFKAELRELREQSKDNEENNIQEKLSNKDRSVENIDDARGDIGIANLILDIVTEKEHITMDDIRDHILKKKNKRLKGPAIKTIVKNHLEEKLELVRKGRRDAYKIRDIGKLFDN